jgi:hypothetical protein
MTEEATYTLAQGGELLNRGLVMAMTPIPEPSTWVMLAPGFGFLGCAGFRSSQKRIPLLG